MILQVPFAVTSLVLPTGETAATVALFADDPESVEGKIATFFDKKNCKASILGELAAAESDKI